MPKPLSNEEDLSEEDPSDSQCDDVNAVMAVNDVLSEEIRSPKAFSTPQMHSSSDVKPFQEEDDWTTAKLPDPPPALLNFPFPFGQNGNMFPFQYPPQPSDSSLFLQIPKYPNLPQMNMPSRVPPMPVNSSALPTSLDPSLFMKQPQQRQSNLLFPPNVGDGRPLFGPSQPNFQPYNPIPNFVPNMPTTIPTNFLKKEGIYTLEDIEPKTGVDSSSSFPPSVPPPSTNVKLVERELKAFLMGPNLQSTQKLSDVGKGSEEKRGVQEVLNPNQTETNGFQKTTDSFQNDKFNFKGIFSQDQQDTNSPQGQNNEPVDISSPPSVKDRNVPTADVPKNKSEYIYYPSRGTKFVYDGPSFEKMGAMDIDLVLRTTRFQIIARGGNPYMEDYYYQKWWDKQKLEHQPREGVGIIFCFYLCEMCGFRVPRFVLYCICLLVNISLLNIKPL